MNNDGRDSIEWRLRRILQNYQGSCSTGDFKDAVLGVHTALEDAINLELGPDARDWPFSQKFQQLFPELHDQYRVEELNRQRNHYAHPKRVFEEGETRQTAQKFVELAIQVWPTLFHTRPPVVSIPAPAIDRAVSQDVSAPGKQAISTGSSTDPLSNGRKTFFSRFLPGRNPGRAVAGKLYRSFFRLPWFSLLGGIVLVACGAVLAGLIEYSIANHLPGVWYWIALPAVLALAAAFFAGWGFWRFLRSLGLRRLLVGITGGALAAILVWVLVTPSARGLGARLEEAAVQVGDGASRVGLEVVSVPFEWGRKIAGEHLAPLVYPLGASDPKEEAEPIATLVATSVSQATASSGTAQINVGGKVKVKTDGKRLRGRESAGLSAPVMVYFPSGEELTVADGPVQADGYTWWKVQGKAGSGWSAENYLVWIP